MRELAQKLQKMKKDNSNYKKIETMLTNTLGTKTTREIYELINELVARGFFRNKSEAVHRGLELLIEMYLKPSRVPLSEMKSATTSIKTPAINYSVGGSKSNQPHESGGQEIFYAKKLLENIYDRKLKAQQMGESISAFILAVTLCITAKNN